MLCGGQHNQRLFSVSLSQAIAERSHGDDHQTLQDLQQENLLQTLPSGPSPSRSRLRWSQQRHQGVLPLPEPEEDHELFVLDLRNFPELANADMTSQNPNIQVGSMHVGRNFFFWLVHMTGSRFRSLFSNHDGFVSSENRRCSGLKQWSQEVGVCQTPLQSLSPHFLYATPWISLAPYIQSRCTAGLSQDNVLSYHMQDL